jgi:hypothetical protein
VAVHDFPLRGGIIKSCFLMRVLFCELRLLRRLYRAVGGWRGEEEDVGKYAGAGGASDGSEDDIVRWYGGRVE